MAAKNKRFVLAVPEDIEAAVAELKGGLFQDESYSEIYRQLIRMGLDRLNAEKAEKKSAGVG